MITTGTGEREINKNKRERTKEKGGAGEKGSPKMKRGARSTAALPLPLSDQLTDEGTDKAK